MSPNAVKKLEIVNALIDAENLSTAEACKRAKVSKGMFYYWRAQSRRESPPKVGRPKLAAPTIIEYTPEKLDRTPKRRAPAAPLFMVAGSPEQLAAFQRALVGGDL